jgi:ferredoxin-NADP reductase/MOSC domain-containing protein YiiM/ferredoxin
MSSLVSVNVGLPRDVEWQGKVVRTAIWKQPVSGRVHVRGLNIDGDGQGDLAGHGGENRAVMVYQLDSYRYWETFLQRHDLEYGRFGENLTVDGLPDNEVCIGDRYRIGSALFEVTQPRVTCYRVGIRMNNPQMPALLVSHRRPGFYFRVIEEGEIGAGDAITKVAEGPECVSVAEVDALLYLPGHPRDQLQRALQIPALSEGWKGSLQALAAANEHAGNVGLAPSSAPPPAWIGFRPLKVAAVRRESVDVLSFILQSVDPGPLPLPLPGQFLVFKVKFENDSAPLLRSYSISGQQTEGTYRISVKRAAGAGSNYFHDRIKAGDILQVSAPRGSFTLAAGTNPVVLLSAGIGATPVLSMLHSLAADSADAQREVWWCYGVRNGREHPFAAEVRRLIDGRPHSHSFITYSRPGVEDQIGKDFDASGHLTAESLQQRHIPQDADFYLCGPASFLQEITAGLKSWGVSDSSIHTEIFGAEASITPGIATAASRAPHPPEKFTGTGPKVSFTRSGLTVPWDSRLGSLLEFAEACDVPVRWSCRVGVCHTCESGLIDGRIGYAPEPLDRPSEGNVLICCSAPLSDIELDL